MSRIQGTAFAPRSSERHEAMLDLSQANFVALHINGDIISCEQHHVTVSDPVGNLPIRFTFAQGWVFVAPRSAAIEQWLQRHRKRRTRFVDWMEGNITAWVVSSFICIAILLWGYVYALPWASDKIAERLPDSVSLLLGEKILQTLDEHLVPSELAASQQQAIRLRVAQHVEKLAPLPFAINVQFRSSAQGANAFALPGGTIILLDELVALAETPAQLDSIILHELGHVHHRHMMKQLVQSTILSVSVSLITGESSGIVDNLAGMGVFIASNGQSREAEKQADHYAKLAMRQIYGSSEPMAEMFERFQQQSEGEVPAWLSTHPDFDSRIDAARSD